MEFTWLSRWQPQLLAILRIVTGLLFLEHGLSKFFGFPVPFPVQPLPPMLMAAGTIEIVAGILVTLGLFTRLASLAGIGFILLFYLCNPPFVGYFYTIPTEGSYLIVNKNLVELASLIVIFLTGSGRFAGLDRFVHLLFARRPRLAPA